MAQRATVFVVERDPVLRERLGSLIDSAGLFVRSFPSGPHFLTGFDANDPGCLVLRMRGAAGLELQERLMRRGSTLPIIVLTGSMEVPDGEHANRLLDCIRRAIEVDRHMREVRSRGAGLGALFAQLTPRERDVMKLVVAGLANKLIAAELGISQKTVEIHRGRVMRKTKATSLADLVRLAELHASNAAATPNGTPFQGTVLYCRSTSADAAPAHLSR